MALNRPSFARWKSWAKICLCVFAWAWGLDFGPAAAHRNITHADMPLPANHPLRTRDFYGHYRHLSDLQLTQTFRPVFEEIVAPGGPNKAQKEKSYRLLVSSYNDPAHYYHVFRHMVSNVGILIPSIEAFLESPRPVKGGHLYHDVVYVAGAEDNEEKSARVARRELPRLGFSKVDTNAASEIIMATKKPWTRVEAGGKETDINYSNDVDLAILAALEQDYQSYATNIMREYKGHPISERIEVLAGMLAKPQLYSTALFRKYLEAPARKNLSDELKLIERTGVTYGMR